MERTFALLRGSPMSVRSDAGSESTGTSGSAARANSVSVVAAPRWRQARSSAAGPWAATIRSSPSSRSANALVAPGHSSSADRMAAA